MNAKTPEIQRDFSAGQIDKEARRRDDTGIMRAALRTARNVSLRPAGGFERRPGSRRRAILEGVAIREQPSRGPAFIADLAAGKIVFRRVDGALHQTISGMPWTAPILSDVRWEMVENTLWVVHRSFRPRLLTYDEVADSWSADTFTFKAGIGGTLLQPYYRFTGSGVTLQPSARTGSVTLTASAAAFDVAQVGDRFRYGEREMTIRSVTSPSLATADVEQDLPPTRTATVASTDGFLAGQAVTTATSDMDGQVVSVVSATEIEVFITKNFQPGTGEALIGPQSYSTISSWSAPASPAATVQWDEAFMSDFRGWPGNVKYDRQRVCLCDFQQFPEAVIWSAIADYFNFAITGDEDGAIFEYVPQKCRVLEVVDGPDQFVVTDRGIYYIPISADRPLVPGGVEFREVDREGAARVPVARIGDAFVFVNRSRRSIMAMSPTGQTARPYLISDVTRFHKRLVRDPVMLASVASGDEAPDDYVFAVNGDGSMIVARYNAQEEWVGWVDWRFPGSVVGVGTVDDVVFVDVTMPDGAVAVVEMDADELGDAAVTVTGAPVVSPFTVADFAAYVGSEVDVFVDGVFIQSATLGSGGSVAAPALPIGTLEAVVAFRVAITVEPFVPNAAPDRADGRRALRRKIGRAHVVTEESEGFRFMGRAIRRWPLDVDREGAPPRTSATHTFRELGRSHDPRPVMTQDEPGRLRVIEIGFEVTI